MPTDAEQLATIKSQTLARLVEITAEHKPSYNLDGQQISWDDYAKQLKETIAWVDGQLNAITPTEIHSQGWS